MSQVSRTVCLAALLLATVAVYGAQRRQRSTRPSLRSEAPAAAPVAADTLRGGCGLTFSGYEKVQSSARESLFINNGTGRRIDDVAFTIEYLDSRGRLLHTAPVTLTLELAPGETRMVQLRSFDTQRVWYYRHSQGRHNGYASPFDVRLTLDYATSPAEPVTEPDPAATE